MKKIQFLVFLLGLSVGVGIARAASSASFLLDTRQSASAAAETGMALDSVLWKVWLSNAIAIDPEMSRGVLLIVR